MADNKIKIDVDDRALKVLQKSIESAISTKAMDAFTKSVERSTDQMSKLVEQQTKLMKGLEDQRRKEGAAGQKKGNAMMPLALMSAIAGGGGVTGMIGAMGAGGVMSPRTVANMLAGVSIARGAGAMVSGAAGYAAQHAPVAEGFMGSALSGIPVIGPMFGAAAGAAAGYRQDFVAMQQSRAQAFGQSGLAGGAYGAHDAGERSLAGMGTQWGLGPTELPPVLSELAQAAAVRGAEELTSRLPDALNIQNTMGIGVGAQGSFQHAAAGLGARTSGSAEREMRAMRDAIATGMEIGIRESRLDEFLQQTATSITQMHEQGIMIDQSSLIGMVRGIGGVGSSFRGQAGVNAALSLTQMTQRLGGGETMMDMMGMQEAGYGREGTSHWQAMMNLEENPTLALAGILRRTRGMGDDSERDRGSRAAMIHSMVSQSGGTLSRRQAYELGSVTEEQLQSFLAPETGTGRLDEFLAQHSPEARAMHGVGAGEAGYQYARAGTGARVSGDLANIRTEEMSMVREYLPMVTEFMSGFATTIGELHRAMQADGMGGVMGRLAEMLTGSDRVVAAATDVGNRAEVAVGASFDALVQAFRDAMGIVTGGLTSLGRLIVQIAGLAGIRPAQLEAAGR